MAARSASISSILGGFPRSIDPGRPGDPGLFGPDTLAWRVNGEAALILGGPRALLMQLAHPAVAAAVAEHSDFPNAPYERLWRTMDAMLTITFGDSEQSARAAERVTAVHRRVKGSAYDALDPDLLLWVHATLVDSALLVHDRFVGGLTPSHRERYYREMKRQAVVLEVPPARLPGNLGDFRRYVARQVDRLAVSEEGRRLAADVLSPPVPLAARPAATLVRVLTAGLLPPRLRREYGLRWGMPERLALSVAATGVRVLLPLSPGVVRRWPHARAAERRATTRSRVPQAGPSNLAR